MWAAPTAVSINTLWASMNLFDIQLLLRPSDILRAIPSIVPHQLIGNTLPMARTTYVVLPCDVQDEQVSLSQGCPDDRGFSFFPGDSL